MGGNDGKDQETLREMSVEYSTLKGVQCHGGKSSVPWRDIIGILEGYHQ